MNKIAKFFVLLLGSVFSFDGNYCGNILGNTVRVNFDNHIANISANVFGQKAVCNNQAYNLSKDNDILFSEDQTTCLNTFLNQFGACPCPPNLQYMPKINTIFVSDEAIYLKKC